MQIAVFNDHARFHGSSIIRSKVKGQNVVKIVTTVTLFAWPFTIPISSFVNVIYSNCCVCVVQGYTVSEFWYISYKLIFTLTPDSKNFVLIYTHFLSLNVHNVSYIWIFSSCPWQRTKFYVMDILLIQCTRCMKNLLNRQI